MGIDYMEIGSSPSDEDCAQLGSDNYDVLSRIELNAYVHQLERMFPYVKNSDSLKFAVKRFNHDFGTYAEVVIYFDTANQFENKNYTCNHTCIEPYEQPWLEQLDVKLIREKVEHLDYSIFKNLEKNDILFIDSSHIIRPEGDVLFEYLELLPLLKPGVIVHIHDIFTPKNYLDNWVITEHRLWNEQYILEAFLTLNKEFKIIGALNFLHHNYSDEFDKKHPLSAQNKGHEPGGFWIQRN